MAVTRGVRISIGLLLSALTLSAYTYERKYAAGEVDHYEILLKPIHFDSELTAVTEHRTVIAPGGAYEDVVFLRANESLAGDLSKRLADARLRLSLAPSTRAFSSWSGADSAVSQIVDSLQMFYIAQHPGTGVGRVRAPGESYDSPELFDEDWTQRPDTLAGRRQSAVRVEMTAENQQTAEYEIRFQPPPESSLRPPRPWMRESPCPGAAISFYSVVAEGVDVRATWGCEQTTVRSEIAKTNGKILRATMATRVLYSERRCQDEALTNCGRIESGANDLDVQLLLRRTDPAIPPDRLMTNAGDGLEYVKIPPGSFTMGCVEGDPDCYPREKPAHRVTISNGFWIGRTEAPVAAFERFLEANGGAMPGEPGSGQMPGYNDAWGKKDHPMVKVSWDQAQSYCAWAGGRLPTEAEWEYAARGGLEGMRYPWGDERSHEEANFWRSGGRDRWKYTAPVASFPANGFGLHDMAGNVYEWTSDWYDQHYYERSPEVDPHGPAEGRRKVARGGGGFLNQKVLRVSARLSADPKTRNVGVGFRCVLPSGSELALRQRLQRLFAEAAKLFE
jgi:formylglycine-generating enzyme required for sulfatase activity